MELEKSSQNIESNKTGFSSQLFAVWLILSAVFFMLSIDVFKTYRSEISILVSAKSEATSKQQKQIVTAMAELPRTLAFYDRMLASNPGVRDVTKGLSPDQRKTRWDEMISVKQSSADSSVITIAITTSRQSDSEQLASKSVRTLFDTTAFYFDVKNDLSLRIIDGPITRAQVLSINGLLAASILLGFVISWLLQYLFFANRSIRLEKPAFLKNNSFFDFKKNTEKTKEVGIESLDDLYKNDQEENYFSLKDFAEDKKEDSRVEEMKKITQKMEPGKYPNFPEMPLPPLAENKSSVPDNLPVADDIFFSQNETAEQALPAEKVEVEKIENETPAIEQSHTEPTPEQLKQRLNQLLRGEF